MGFLSYWELHAYVQAEFPKVAVPQGPARRSGADILAARVLQHLETELRYWQERSGDSSLNVKKAADALADIALELCSLLYSAGAEHTAWKHWCSLASFGMFLCGRIHESAQYAALGGEWEFVEALPAVPVESQQESERVVWILLGKQSASDLPERFRDEYGDTWLQLARGVLSQDHQSTEAALKLLAEYWMEETSSHWREFFFGRYPAFETPLCVAAAVARRRGYAPASLDPDHYRFLEAGLAAPDPAPMFPGMFSLPPQPEETGG